MNNNILYRDFSQFISTFFQYKVQKITINAGFTCPNRDGSKGYGGCTYCNNESFSPMFEKSHKTIKEQLDKGIKFFSHKYPKMKYLAYFQSYTNTYGDIDDAINKYEEALKYENIVGIVISTRPDCMPNEILNYLENLSKSKFVLVEYGIESTINSTLDRINRLHSFEETEESILKTAEKNIKVGGHLIIGLPGETKKDILNHAIKISQLPLTTIKLHQLQIIKGTSMAAEFKKHPEKYNLFTIDEYIDLCIDFTELLNPSFYIERFASQSPKELVISPNWGIKNYELTSMIKKRMIERDSFQGKLYKKQSYI